MNVRFPMRALLTAHTLSTRSYAPHSPPKAASVMAISQS